MTQSNPEASENLILASEIRSAVSVALSALCIGATWWKLGFMPALGMFAVWLLGVSVGHASARVSQGSQPQEKTERVEADAPPAAPKKVVAEEGDGWVSDPGKQALEMLRRGENCDWYSIKHTNELHEAFDCLEIYWRTNVEHPERNKYGYGRGPFELKAGFRVRWHVSSTHNSHVEAVGIDLMSTILEARELADQLVARAKMAESMGHTHPALEAWKAKAPERKYSFHGLDIEKWHVRLDYPGGLSWAESPELEQAVADALAKAPA